MLELSAVSEGPILPDLIQPGLRVVFCGTAAGRTSKDRRQYYAHPRNRFWPTLAEVGLVECPLQSEDYAQLLVQGIGLTDLAKGSFGLDRDLPPDAFDRAGLERKILENAPRVLAFNGKKAAAAFFGRRRALAYGPQPDAIGPTAVWVLPSTSAANRRWKIEPWRELAAFAAA